MANPWLEKASGLSITALLAHLPSGVAWLAFRVFGKVSNRLFTAWSREYEAAWNSLHALSRELDYRTTEQMVSEWEAALGLPDPCLPSATTLEDRKKWIRFRLDKKRWSTLDDWYELAEIYGVRVRITPGFIVQKPSLIASIFPIQLNLFPKLGRFRIYIDLLDEKFGGFPYDGATLEEHKFPIPFGGKSDFARQFRCMIERVAPANVLIIWNEFPIVPPNGNTVTFSADFEEDFS